ncbi:ATP-binding protein [Actinomadura coerulea]|uniref:ATP-binding protein n=1 Tax=Actinomadura coerulea TaxID=46159 RepID=UPI0034275BA9
MSVVAQSPEVSTVVLEPTDEAPLLARRFLSDQFAAWKIADDYAACVVISELVTNAYRHGEGFIVVRLFQDLDGLAVLEVWDAGEHRPMIKPQDDAALSGRGLQIISEMAKTWGVRSLNEGGKAVWAKLPVT